MAMRRQNSSSARSAPYSIAAPSKSAYQGTKMAPSRLPKANTGPSLALPLTKKFGQHLLKNQGIVEKIVSAADIKSSDTVLEIGPGTGNMTIRICPLARHVQALDIDPRMAAEVVKRCNQLGYSNITGRQGDALRADLGKFDVCVANMPYQISSPFVFRIIAHRPLWRCAVLMFQKEFSDRLACRPGDKHYGRLSINTQLFCKVEKVCFVDPSNFNPPPKVDSLVVKLTPRVPTLQVNFREWDSMIRICFIRKNKTLLANFNSTSVLSVLENNYKVCCSVRGLAPERKKMKTMVEEVLEAVGLKEERSRMVDIDTYFKLLLEFHKRNIYFCQGTESGEKKNENQQAEEDLKYIDSIDFGEMEDEEEDD